MRLDLLKVVGSRHARLARPDADSPARAASRSIADQIRACVSIGGLPARQPEDRGLLLPSPLWGGVGGGGRRLMRGGALLRDPPPRPSSSRNCVYAGFGHSEK